MKKLIGHNSKELLNGLQEVTKSIESKLEIKFVNENVYVFKGDFSKIKSIKLSDIEDLGICDRRRLRRYINSSLGGSLRSLNKLIHFVYKNILNSPDNASLVIPRHDAIQKLKKQWIKIRNESDDALNAYKESKGNFYKEVKRL